jgi:hypothetical protein
MIIGNYVEQANNAVYLPANVKKALVSHNDFSGSDGYHSVDTENIFDINLLEFPHNTVRLIYRL